MSGGQWNLCGWAFIVAAFAINGDTTFAVWTATIVAIGAFVVGVIRAWQDTR